MRAAEVLTAQYKAAVADRASRQAAEPSCRHGHSRLTLASGAVLITSIVPRSSNSRGARRGGHDVTEYNILEVGQQYSKRIAARFVPARLQAEGFK